MSRFGDAMGLVGNPALVMALGDPLVYWPGGVEASAVTRSIIFEVGGSGDRMNDMGSAEVSLAEAQVWADDVRGVASVQLKKDVIVRGGVRWLVVRLLGTVGGMHRVQLEQVVQTRAGGGRAFGAN